ncbi:HAMP domain-containing histidine kinase [Massilia sp. H-1]|nr:HAMP domain-containing histidine kinase [Massilia sp. H-1]
MSGELRALMDNQRRLLHDVSHELRSPLARLQAAIGLAHQQPKPTWPPRWNGSSAKACAWTNWWASCSRWRASMRPLHCRKAKTSPSWTWSTRSPPMPVFEAEHQNRHVAVSGAAPVLVRGAPDLLWRAIENVVRNAVKHSTDGGGVEIMVEAAGSEVLLRVIDDGPGVAQAELETIFQPFYRASPGASNIDGHGLGLAIARRVVQAHGGRIDAANREAGGLCVTIALPCVAAPV